MEQIVVMQPLGIAEEHLAELRELGEVTYYDKPCKDGAEWLEHAQNADIILTNITGFRDAWQDAKDVFITLSFVGYGFMDIKTLKKHNVLVANSPGCNQVAVTEWIVAMLLNYTRNLPQSIGMTKADDSPSLGTSVYGKSVCIMGRGNIGARAGRALEALGMKVNYYTRHDTLEDKIGHADFIIDCLSLNPSTQNFYDDVFFGKVKDGVVFMSISPNETQDLGSIERNLQSGKIKHFISDNASALLYDAEDSTYERMSANPNITVTPHMASYADNTAKTANKICVENIKAYLAGKPTNLIGGHD